MPDRRDRLSSMTGPAPATAPVSQTVRVRPPRPQLLLYAPPPAQPGPWSVILESEGVDVLVAQSPETAVVLLDNAKPSLVFAIVPVLGEELRELFRNHAPGAEVRVIPGLVSMLEGAVASPKESFDFAVRAIVATAGILSAERATPRGRSARILAWAEDAARMLGFTATETSAVRIAAALCDVPAAISSTGERPDPWAPTKKSNRELRRGLLAEYIAGLQPPFEVPDAGDRDPDLPPTSLDIVDAAAEYASLTESRADDAALLLRKQALAGELHPVAVEAVIGAATGSTRAEGRRILIVDPDPASRNMLALRLANEGYATDVAADGRTALDAILRDPPALVISEVVLPGLDGYALLDAIARDSKRPVPFVFLTARGDPASANKGLLLGAADYFTKPMNLELLLTKLQKVLGDQIAAGAAAARISLADVGGPEPGEAPMLSYAQLQPGVSVMNRFRLLADLGEGGMGRVFRARDERLEEDVVLKVMKSALTGDDRMLTGFKREIRLARRIAHPAVVRIFDFWEAGTLRFVTMESLEGRDLAAELKRRGAFPPGVALRLAHALFEGLAAAHDLGVLHRDIKPHNVFLTTAGQLKILDFGIAQALGNSGPDAATVTHSVIGTPAYMSPEQLLGEPLDQRSDLYSAGVVLYEMLVAQLPFGGAARIESVTARLHRKPDAPSRVATGIAPEIDALVLGLLARDREDRPPDARAAAAAVARLRQQG